MQHFGWNSSIHINFGHLIHALLQGHMNSHSRPWASYSFGKRRRKKTKEKKRKAVSLKSRKIQPTLQSVRVTPEDTSPQAKPVIRSIMYLSLSSHGCNNVANMFMLFKVWSTCIPWWRRQDTHTLFVWFVWGLCRSVRSVLIEQTHKLRNSDIFTTRKYKCIQLLLTVDSCMTSERAEIWEPNQFLCETRLDLWRSLLIIGIHSDVTLK